MFSLTKCLFTLKKAINNNDVETEEYYKKLLLAYTKTLLTQDIYGFSSLLYAFSQDDQLSIDENINSILNNSYEMPDDISEIPEVGNVYGGNFPRLINALQNYDRNEILQAIEAIEASRKFNWSDAIEDNDKDKILELIDSGEDVNQVWLQKSSYIPSTPLLAAISQNLGIASMLLEYGADPNVSIGGFTPIRGLLELNHTDRLQEFVDAGADINYRFNDAKPTFLTKACEEPKSLNAIRNIISSGADVNLGFYNKFSGKIPLSVACKNNYLTIAQELISAGADVAKVNPLPTSQAAGYEVIIELVKAGARVTQQDIDYMSDHLDEFQHRTLSKAAELANVIYGNDGSSSGNEATDYDVENNQNNSNQEAEAITISDEELGNLTSRVRANEEYRELMKAQFKARFIHDPSANISENPLYKNFADLLNKEIAEDDNLRSSVKDNLKTYIRENIQNPTLKKALLKQFSEDNFPHMEKIVKHNREDHLNKSNEEITQYDIYSEIAGGLKIIEGNLKKLIEDLYQSIWVIGEKNITSCWTNGKFGNLDWLESRIIKSNYGWFEEFTFLENGGANMLQDMFADEIATKLDNHSKVTENEKQIVLNWDNIQHKITEQIPLASNALRPMLENDYEKVKAIKSDIREKIYNKQSEEKLTKQEGKYVFKNIDTLISKFQTRDREAEEGHIPGASARLGLEEDSSDEEESSEVEAYNHLTTGQSESDYLTVAGEQRVTEFDADSPES
jgi:hypothetical protein